MAKRENQPPNRKLIMLGQVPPPLHGQAVVIKSIVDGLSDRLDIVHVPMRFSETVFDNGRLKFHKITHLFSLIARTLWLLIRFPGSVLYYPPAPASWVPVLRDLVILSFTRPFASKTIFHFHAHGIGKFIADRKWLRLLSWAWRWPHHVVVLGDSCLKDVMELLPRKISVVPYGINIETATRKRPSSGKIVVLYVGMLAETKGIFDLLATADLLRDLDIEFRLVGTYKYSDTQPRFESERAKLGLDSRVITCGKRSGQELWQEYADADIFFFPTYFETETFGVVLLEAMAHALPVVASRWRGPKDIIRDERCGILCEPHDTQGFADAIRSLALDKSHRLRLGRVGQALCATEYSLTSFLKSMEGIFIEAGCRSKSLPKDATIERSGQTE